MLITSSGDDDFYDRTQKSSKHKTGEDQSVETADSLLDKKDAVVKKMEDKRKLLLGKDKVTEINEVVEAGDALDAYMSAVSSQLGVLILLQHKFLLSGLSLPPLLLFIRRD